MEPLDPRHQRTQATHSSGDGLWSPLKESGSLTDRIAVRIGSLISEQGLEPGTRLPSEREMAKLLGVSRPALREAVKVLEARGRLVVRHGQGVFVGNGSPDALRDELMGIEVTLAELYAMREVLEVPAAAWAAEQASEEDLVALERSLVQQEEARSARPLDYGRLGKLDAEFHLLIVETAGNRFLKKTLGILQEMLSAGMETTLTIPGRVGQSRRDHQAIFEAIRAGDCEGARRASLAHIQGARDAALERVHQQGRSGSEPEISAAQTGHHVPPASGKIATSPTAP